jgi:hypothetical protein
MVRLLNTLTILHIATFHFVIVILASHLLSSIITSIGSITVESVVILVSIYHNTKHHMRLIITIVLLYDLPVEKGGIGWQTSRHEHVA